MKQIMKHINTQERFCHTLSVTVPQGFEPSRRDGGVHIME